LPTKLWLDTDFGGDVDDALALALVLGSPEIELAGVSTVYFDSAWRAGAAKKMLELYGRSEVPVKTGAQKPLLGHWDERRNLNTAEDAPVFTSAESGAEGIIKACKDFPDISIAAIGPLTNLAAAIVAAPSAFEGRSVYIMGGDIDNPLHEWNFMCDPLAAKIALESKAVIKLVGLNVTTQCAFDDSEVKAFSSSKKPQAAYLGEMIQNFIRLFNRNPILHDPLSLSPLLWDDVLEFENRPLDFGYEFASSDSPVEYATEYPVLVATGVKASLFKKRFLERVL
jgi:purine nucleosidase/pyrimidine-specific ribonucleoside hydrolase